MVQCKRKNLDYGIAPLRIGGELLRVVPEVSACSRKKKSRYMFGWSMAGQFAFAMQAGNNAISPASGML
nr:MAG TPA: Putative esterase [Caudoviricetes sp.]